MSPRPEVPQQIGATMRFVRPRRALFKPSVIAGAPHPESMGIPKPFGGFYKIGSMGHDHTEIRTDLVFADAPGRIACADERALLE